MSKTVEKVYIVTSGEYSGYSIDAVFSTREKADRYIETHSNESYCIEEWKLDQESDDKPGQLPFLIQMQFNGDCRIKPGNADDVESDPFSALGST